MAATIVDADLTAFLDAINTYVESNWELGLFKSNTTITRATVMGDLTEADFGGYARIALNDFAGATLAGNVASAVSTAEVFAYTSGTANATVYGYFVYDSAAAKLVIAEKFTVAKSMSVAGDTITITPTDTLRQNGV